MKNSKFQGLNLNAATLTREQMKNVVGGTTIKCFKCCPDDKCSTKPHVCPANNCGPQY